MNVSDRETGAVVADDDQALRAGLRQALADAPRRGHGALQARVLRQWGELHATGRPRAGPLIALHALGRHPVLAGGALFVLGAAALLLLRSWLALDAGVDELMQPDVLSLVTMGVL